ncbi:hypothetical protein [Hankyongella ginsenosidimutans]|uniref:hypothetical protein n=1 Tax=Hankyongella ginsenosidimutans TaxID=1763828 RepID=UPI001CA311CA|nr:hypothetical protein [Hankyongella ginsenosidimutans]
MIQRIAAAREELWDLDPAPSTTPSPAGSRRRARNSCQKSPTSSRVSSRPLPVTDAWRG